MTIEAIRVLEAAVVPPPADGFGFDRYGWAPYGLDDFLRLLDYAIRVAPRASFVDIGCGIGTKCLAAQARGLSAYGIDCVPEYVRSARDNGVEAVIVDARTWTGFSEFGIVYVSHPLRDPAAEGALERRVFRQMASGSVFMTLRGGAPVPRRWRTVHEERYERAADPIHRWRGVYVKEV